MKNSSHTFTYFCNALSHYWKNLNANPRYSTKALIPASLQIAQRNRYQDFVDNEIDINTKDPSYYVLLKDIFTHFKDTQGTELNKSQQATLKNCLLRHKGVLIKNWRFKPRHGYSAAQCKGSHLSVIGVRIIL